MLENAASLSKMYGPDLSQVVTKRRDLVIFWRDGYHFCLIFKQKAGWLVGMSVHLYVREKLGIKINALSNHKSVN